MVVKLNMSKAYDRVEWDFLIAMMEKMGFCEVWRNWIKECLKSVSYAFNINGEVREYVVPSREIRQGGPLLPYLFLICFEGLSNLLKKAESNKRMNGLKLSRNGPSLTHAFFADDTLIFL